MIVQNFWNDLKRWAASPYRDDMDAMHWIYFLGFMLCVTFLWSRAIKLISTMARG